MSPKYSCVKIEYPLNMPFPGEHFGIPVHILSSFPKGKNFHIENYMNHLFSRSRGKKYDLKLIRTAVGASMSEYWNF